MDGGFECMTISRAERGDTGASWDITLEDSVLIAAACGDRFQLENGSSRAGHIYPNVSHLPIEASLKPLVCR